MRYLQDMTFSDVAKLIKEIGQPAYRAVQLYKWIA